MHRFLRLALPFIAFFVRTAEAAENVDPAKSPVLDVFPSGPWMGMNAVFQAPNFDATLNKDRVLSIQPKVDGKNSGSPVVFTISTYYYVDGNSRPRPILSLEKRSAPAMQPKKVEFAGHCEQKVKFTFSIQFSEKGVTVEGDVVDPPGLKPPTVFGYAPHFASSHQIPAETVADEIRKMTAGYTVKFTDAKRQSDVKQFWEVEKNRIATVASAEVIGPWGTRRVITEMPATPKNGQRPGSFVNYTNSAFYKGGWYFSRGGTDKVPGGPITVRIE